MIDHDRWLTPLVLAGLCTAAMAVLVVGIALALGTTGHDWYAAWKLTLIEAMLGLGFSDHGLVEYRTAAGETVTVARYRLAYVMHEPWRARRLIVSLAADRAVLGACTGLALVALWLAVRASAGLRRLWNGRGAVVERAPRARPGHSDRMRRPDMWSDGELIEALARRGRLGVLPASASEAEWLADGSPARTPGAPPPAQSLPPPATAAPARASTNRLPTAEPSRSAKPEPAAARQNRTDIEKDETVESAHRAGARREHGRWV